LNTPKQSKGSLDEGAGSSLSVTKLELCSCWQYETTTTTSWSCHYGQTRVKSLHSLYIYFVFYQ